MQRTTLIGNLGNDPELRDAKGTPVCSFSVATTEHWKDAQGKDKEKTEWHRVIAWGKLAGICDTCLNKGTKVYIGGKNRTRKWTDQNGVERSITEIHAHEMEKLHGGRNSSSHENESLPPQGSAGDSSYHDDDVPF